MADRVWSYSRFRGFAIEPLRVPPLPGFNRGYGAIPKMSDRAIYLGDGIWWQLSERQLATGHYGRLPQRIRRP